MSDSQDLPIAFSGEVMLLKWAESSGQGRTVTFRIPDDEPEHAFRRMATATGKQAGQRFMAVLVMLNDDETPNEQTVQKPYGKNAHALYRSGWMYNRNVLKACGTPDRLAEWVSRQPCCLCKAAGPSSVLGDRNGYLKLPVCNLHRHTDISAIASKNPKFLQNWVSSVICKRAGVDSLGEILPSYFMKICEDMGIRETVPATYLEPD